MDRPEVLYIVVPCYNEEEVLPETARRLGEKLRGLVRRGLAAPGSRVLFVDDGSRDRTWALIARYHRDDPAVAGVKLAHNRGHQNALLAGLMAARERCGVTISLDADLQDDMEAMDQMLEQFYGGCDIVYGVRNDRAADTPFKRGTALAFYRLMAALGAETVYNHADYRLMSRRALDGLSQYREVNLFLRGLVPLVGYRAGVVEYRRGERLAGESKYSLSRMLNFAIDGITSLSVRPIRLMAAAGGAAALRRRNRRPPPRHPPFDCLWLLCRCAAFRSAFRRSVFRGASGARRQPSDFFPGPPQAGSRPRYPVRQAHVSPLPRSL